MTPKNIVKRNTVKLMILESSVLQANNILCSCINPLQVSQSRLYCAKGPVTSISQSRNDEALLVQAAVHHATIDSCPCKNDFETKCARMRGRNGTLQLDYSYFLIRNILKTSHMSKWWLQGYMQLMAANIGIDHLPKRLTWKLLWDSF